MNLTDFVYRVNGHRRVIIAELFFCQLHGEGRWRERTSGEEIKGADGSANQAALGSA
jgi:hypothetical protein